MQDAISSLNSRPRSNRACLVLGVTVKVSHFMGEGAAFCRVMADVAVVQGEAGDVEGLDEGC